jgi:ABC-2 type transport system permease protein
MKAIDIALKDLTSSFRSAVALVFMFGIPLLVTGMFSFMFGNVGGGEGFDVPVTSVIIADLDRGNRSFEQSAAYFEDQTQADTLGKLMVEALQSPDFANLLDVSHAADAAAARAAVDSQQAGVAIIIPPDFSQQFVDLDGQATLEFYADPTLTLGPSIVRSVLSGFSEGFSGAKIAIDLALEYTDGADPFVIGQVIQQYAEGLPTGDLTDALLEVHSPASVTEPQNLMVGILGPIMGGMLIFYAFYTGTATAQTILREEEQRTLPRLFTTPTPERTILTGKFLAVFLTVLVQVVVLLLAARLIFGIRWGAAGNLALMATGTILCASSFGIFVNSLLKDTKQSSMIFGGVLTFTGMIGMIPIFTLSNPAGPGLAGTVALLVPQGWANRALLQTMSSAPAGQVALSALVLLVWAAAFFAIGVWRFKKRYL